MKKFTTIFSLLLLNLCHVFAQNYNMANGNVSTCSGNFYDSGGAAGNYLNNQTFVFTICPSTPGAKIRVNFTAFNIENAWDFLYVYDGNSTAAPSLGTYTGTAGPGQVQATTGNASGCITFRFTSDGSITASGWAAIISCITPCQTIQANLVSSNPAPQADGIVRICQGASVSFTGSGTFSNSGAGATYNWNFGNGQTGLGQNVSTTYPNAGIYKAALTVRDPSNCQSNNPAERIIHVSTTPTFTTTATPPSICLGASSTVGATPTPTPFLVNCTPPVAGTTFLPDGSGVSYTTSIPVGCFNVGQTFTSATDLQNVCINMEHSYLGDLNIELICPNGQTVVLKAYSQGGGGTYLGCPLDDPAVGPGTGSTYCFTPTAVNPILSAGVVVAPTTICGTPAAASVVAGNYQPFQPFTGFIGCPLNGNWTIRITDNLAADNGYIFSWDLNFAAPAPSSASFTPTFTSQGWQAATGLTVVNSTTASVTPTAVGNSCYTYRVTDNFGCNYTTTQCVNVTAGLTPTITGPTTVCSGNSVSLTASGGNTYSWSNGVSGATISVSPAVATVYTVTATDVNGCRGTSNITVTPRSFTASATPINAACASTNGAVNVTINSGGIAPYTFVWSNGRTTQNISNLGPGSYTVTVTDNGGCTATVTGNVSQPVSFTSSAAPVNSTCNYLSNGSINLTVNGGAAPISYIWSNGRTTEDITGLNGNTYTVTITDANNCSSVTSVVVTQPTALVLTPSSTNVLCNTGTNGSINLAVSGGTSTYTYNWSNGRNTQNNTGLTAGIYTVTVTDNNGCTSTSTSTVTQPTALTSSTTVTNVLCNAAATGALNLSVGGGTSGYNFNWSNGSNTQNISGLAAGNYTVTVTDANGCTTTNTSVITQPTALNTSVANNSVACNSGSNGFVNLTVNGGTAAYNFNWSNGANTQNISNLAAGTYTVTVTDANNCTTTNSATITQPTAVTVTNVPVNVLCNGRNTGTVTLNISGGTSGYNFIWSNGRTTQNLTGLLAGTYTVTVSDANGCSTTSAATITQPTALVVSSTTQNALCNGASNGSVNLNVSGGTSAYTFNWNNGRTNEDISGLAAGIYLVTVTDANGCTTSVSGVVGQPSQMTSTTTVTNALCNGSATGSINLNSNGGTGAYTFNWSNASTTRNISALTAGTYSVTITDANGCTITNSGTITEPTLLTATNTFADALCNGALNGSVNLIPVGGTTGYSFGWSNGATSQNISNLAAGTYTVTVTDANGCTVSSSATIGQPAVLSATNTFVDILCNSATTGSVTLSVNGGTTSYGFLWSNGQNTQNISNLAAGTYTVTVTDANGCTTTSSATLSQPTVLSSSNSFVNVSCNGGSNGSVDLTVNGGVTNYTYTWSNAANTEDISNLSIGTYTVTITDANGCTNTSSAVVTEPTLLVSSNTFVDILCNNGNNGSVDLSVSGGVTNYAYIWSNGQTSQDISGLTAGSYTVTVTDANGCQTVSSANISQPTQLTVSASPVDILCNAATTGSVTLNVNGGTSAYSFLWSNGANTQNLNNISAGVYTATITDANGCSLTSTSTLTEPTALTSSNTSTNVSCNGGSNGTVDLTVNGGVINYTYNWSNAANTEDLNGIAIGVYTVTITDNNGCTTTSSATVTEPTLLTSSNNFVDVACNGNSTGSVTLSVNGGTSPYSFNWSNGSTSQNINALPVGTYTVTVTDANGCVTTTSATLNQPTALSTSTTSIIDATCSVAGSVDIVINGGAGGYSFLWSNTNTTEDLVGLSAGSYTLTITDANGCQIVNGPNLVQSIGTPSASLLSTSNVSCNGGNNGAIDVSVSGGVPGYSYNWSNGATTEDLNTLPAGTYNLTVTDNIGCITNITAVNIIQPTALALSNTATNALCNRSADGTISLTVTGGTSGYSFIWSNGAFTEDITGLASGFYTVTVIDANNCEIVSSAISIADPSAIVLTNVSITDANCGSSNGAITVAAGGGTPGYAYQWSNGDTGTTISNLLGDDYIVTVTDNNGCIFTQNIFVANSLDIIIDIIHTDENCNQPGSGTMEVVLSGGTPPYNIAWSNGSTSQTLTNVSAGFYSVNVTDNNSCFDSDSVVILTPFQPNLNAVVLPTFSVDTTVNWNDITTVSGGNNQSQNGVTYSWSYNGPGNANFVNASLVQTEINPDRDGDYTLFLTATSADGCIDIDTLHILVEANNPQIPTAFSPNGDNTNEVFRVVNLDKDLITEFQIFNRWGQLIYDNVTEAEWNGKFNGTDQPRDVYMFIIKWKSPNSEGETSKRGHVTLLR